MRQTGLTMLSALALLGLAAGVLHAQPARQTRPAHHAQQAQSAQQTQQAPRAIRLWPGKAPGSEDWTWKEKDFHVAKIGTVAENVVTPTLTPYLPPAGKASGTGIIVAPGGGCIALTMDNEGSYAARWLERRGIAAFVLKYRLQHKTADGMPKDLDEDVACQWGIADAARALAIVRQHAKEWHVAPDRVGIMGFSAGGMIASEVLVARDAAARPAFAGLIYGAPFHSMPAIPRNLPPVFMAWTQTDPIALHAMTRFYGALLAAGDKPEAHIYSAGGHGFGMLHQGTTSDHWIEELYYWLEAKGLAQPARAAPARESP